MIKKSILVLLFTLLFTGCAERGYIVNITPTKAKVDKTTEIKSDDFPTLKLNSSREDKMQKTISGSLILIIGLILIL